MSFFWYQLTGGEDAWIEALSEHRKKIVEERKPAFVTVLDAYSSPDDTWGRDDYAKMKYSGPLYFDWDAENLSDTIPEFQRFLKKLEDMGVNLNSLRLYVTGGRGFHLEIPMPVFMPKAVKGGVTALPYIYREMAMELVVDTLDMRVYTGRRGRMWRTPGVERSNGKFKVPILVSQAWEMTEELYDELCAEPLGEPLRDLPELNPSLAALFLKAQTKVEEANKRRAKAGTADEALLAKFKGQFPPTMERIMRGEGLLDGVGFHKVAMQLAITANALGKTADQLVEASEGLIKTHAGDSSRYGSPRKRREELRRMWEYTHDNPCYSYSRGGLRALLHPDTPSSDLDGLNSASVVGVGHVPEEEDEEALPAEVAAELSAAQASLFEGLMITGTGVHKRTAEGARTISNIGFRKPTQLVDADDYRVIGIEADVLCDGQFMGRHTIPGRVFTSRSNLSAFCADYGGIFSGSDTQAGVVQLMLSRSAKKGGRVVYALNKEGLDLVQNPLIKDRSVHDVVWVFPDEVVTENTEAQYVFQPKVASSAVYWADVHNAKQITNTEDTKAWVHNLLRVNAPVVVAQMLGWYVSCFHKQFYQQAFGQFPLLHPNGPAGCGKTMTSTLFARLFYLKSPVVIKSCSPQVTTNFSLKAAFTGSASIPLILDEYKPTEMGMQRTDMLLQAFRTAYNQGTGSSGGMSKGGATASFREVTDYTYSAPIVFLGESQEMQTAVVQRSLMVNMNTESSKRHEPHYKAALAGADNMSALGRLLLRYAYQETLETRKDALNPIMEMLAASFDTGVHPRQIYNLAVAMEGLNYLDSALATVFGSEFREQMQVLKDALFENRIEINAPVMSEAAKMLNDISLITRTEDPESEFAIREGYEYVVLEGHVEILMRETFVKYFAWCKRKGFVPYYANVDAFVVAMGKFPATTDRLCLSSPLKTSGQARVFRFSLDKLSAEGIEGFKSKAD